MTGHQHPDNPGGVNGAPVGDGGSFAAAGANGPGDWTHESPAVGMHVDPMSAALHANPAAGWGPSNGSLACNVLVLNRDYLAIRVVNVKRAVCLLFKELAEVIHVEDGQYLCYDFGDWCELSVLKREFEPHAHDWLRTVRFDIAVPRIIRLTLYDRLPRQEVKFNRRNIYARDGNRCQYCGHKHSTSDLSLDHVVPRSQGGRSTWDNIVCACLRCNIRKGGRTPAEAGMKLIAAPKRPKRNPVISLKLSDGRYASWKAFLDNAYWSVELK